ERDSDSDRTMNMYGTTLRSWDPTTQSWHIAWTNPVRGHREEQVGRWNGRDILQEGTRPDGTKTRWTFTEITEKSFRWRGEAMYPDKSTWTLEAEFLATRRGQASRSCCPVHAAVGWSGTATCTARRRSWARNTRTKSSRYVTVGTTKKSAVESRLSRFP